MLGNKSRKKYIFREFDIRKLKEAHTLPIFVIVFRHNELLCRLTCIRNTRIRAALKYPAHAFVGDNLIFDYSKTDNYELSLYILMPKFFDYAGNEEVKKRSPTTRSKSIVCIQILMLDYGKAALSDKE